MSNQREDSGNVPETPTTGDTPPPTRSRAKMIALITTGALILGGGTAAGVHHVNATRLNEARDAHAAAQATWDTARDALADALEEAGGPVDQLAALTYDAVDDTGALTVTPASLTLAIDDGREVREDALDVYAVITATQAALDAKASLNLTKAAATDLLENPVTVPIPGNAMRDEYTQAAAAFTAATELTQDALDALTAATEAANQARDTLILARAYNAAIEAGYCLAAAIEYGERVLYESEGYVDDNAVRQNLRDALDAGIALPAPGSSDDVDTLTQAATVAADVRAEISAQVESVRAAVAARQEREEREAREAAEAAARAAEQARQAAARQPARGGGQAPATGGGNRGGSGNAAGTGGGGGATSGGGSGGGNRAPAPSAPAPAPPAPAPPAPAPPAPAPEPAPAGNPWFLRSDGVCRQHSRPNLPSCRGWLGDTTCVSPTPCTP